MKTLLRLLLFVKPHKRLLLAAMLTMVVSTLLQMALPRLLGVSIDRIVQRGELRFLLYTGVGIIGITLLRSVFAYMENYLRETIAQRVAYDVRNALYTHLQRLSYGYHDRQQTGDLMARATSDVDNVRYFVSLGVMRGTYLVVLVLSASGLLLSLNWPLALMCLGFIPIVALRGALIARRLRVIWSRAQDRNGELETILQENLTGMRVVKAFGRRDYEIQKFSYKARELMDENLAAIGVQATNTPLMNFLFTGLIALMLWFGGREIIAGRFTPGELTQFILYLALLQWPVRMTGWLVNTMSRAISSGQRVFEVLDAQSPVQERPTAITLQGARGHVVLDHVSFTYDHASPVLRDVSFEARPGQALALVGPTGSGKTTIAHLLPRFYDVTAGHILIDGVDVRDVTLESLRRTVGVVQQDVFLFSARIRDNIAYGAVDATDERVRWAAKLARLDDFIESLPEGYDTWVGERGITLSGGQKQRIAIARTLLMDPPVLVLDDSTSSVDTRTEYLIQEALWELIEGRTTFIIAQRLSTVQRASLILVLEGGRIVQQGTHRELLAVTGPYRQIYELQLRPQEQADLPAPRTEVRR